MALLSLPRELRNNIYSHVATPFAPVLKLSGLYLSCRQIKAELDLEHQLSLDAYIRILRKGTQGVRITLPDRNTIGRPRLHISLATSIFSDYPADPLTRLPPLPKSRIEEVLSNPFTCVTITFHEDAGVRFGIDNIRWIHQNLILGLVLPVHEIHTRRIVVQPPALTGSWISRWIDLSVSAGLRHRDWTAGWVVPKGIVEEELTTGMVWERLDEERIPA